MTIVLFVSSDSQNGLNSLLACDLKRCGFVNGMYILYSLVFPQRGVSLQDVLLMFAVLFRLWPAIVLQRHHVLCFMKERKRAER